MLAPKRPSTPNRNHISIQKLCYKKNDVPVIVDSHYFNHSISLVIPDAVKIPDELRNCISEDSDYYRVTGLKIDDLIDEEFIEAFVKKGELSILAIEKKIDVDNSMCVTPTGHLVMSILGADYEKLGWSGKNSDFRGSYKYCYGESKVEVL